MVCKKGGQEVRLPNLVFYFPKNLKLEKCKKTADFFKKSCQIAVAGLTKFQPHNGIQKGGREV